MTTHSDFSRRSFLKTSALGTAVAVYANQAWPDEMRNRTYKQASSLSSDGPIRFIPASRSGIKVPRIAVVSEGAIVEDLDCSGCYVSIQANNVTLRRCRFTAIDGVAIVVDLYNKCGNLAVESCHFDGMKQNVKTDAMLRARDGAIYVRDCLFENLPNDAIKMVGGSIERCVFRSSGYLAGGHSDAITVYKTVSSVLIRDNDIDFRKGPGAPTEPTSAIAIGSENGDTTDVLVERNRLRGGGYTIYVTLRPELAEKFKLERVTIRDNVIGDWLYGPLYPHGRPIDLVFENNRRIDGGAILLERTAPRR